MKDTKFASFLHGSLPKGCAHCVKGEKMVLFVTGVCPRKCNFCPISDEKNGKDYSYADEWKTNDIKDIITEASAISAKGAGFTGGDPLARMERTVKYIRALKKKFGKGFHIHLYTSLDLVDDKKMKRLFKAGLDEIRFHFDLDDKKYWGRIDIPIQYSWDVGVEIPVIPGKVKQMKRMVDFIGDKVKFLNLNELEIPDNSFHSLVGIETKDSLSYAARGSVGMGMKILEYVEKKYPRLSVHLCTARTKDAYQLANRLRRRAKNIARKFDHVDDEGMITRGAIYIEETKPGFSYRKRLAKLVGNKKIIGKLQYQRRRIISLLGLFITYLF